MQCPFCRAPDTRVVDSRLAEDGSQVRRRRECESCNGRFTTFEKAAVAMPYVIKRSGQSVPFDEDKLRKGLAIALYKRPVTPEAIDLAVEHIVRRVRQSPEREIPSQRIGEWVMEELHTLDHVAYVRFASIYRSFEDVNAFAEEILRLRALPSAEERKSQLPLIGDASGAKRP